MTIDTTDKKALRDLAKGFIEQCWPDDISEAQRHGITLSFYAGMMAMFQVMSQISKHPDEDTAAGAVELMIKSLGEVSEEEAAKGE